MLSWKSTISSRVKVADSEAGGGQLKRSLKLSLCRRSLRFHAINVKLVAHFPLVQRSIFFLFIFLGVVLPAPTRGWVLNGFVWPGGTQIVMQLGLLRTAVPLQDGSASWTASAADALRIWNEQIDSVKFVEAARGQPLQRMTSTV